ncbi:hypothetical protein [Nostoc sp. 106C]|uniref:hypothetical protein n=1 Tax=Nostoc sp. 106C TaxID=1932667 RepID=UPI000A38F392|nr:hypothetical protein [Nostoc sp. 106C]OUL22043.1 hypothetical protein BV375_28055 [Nostoc sp. 106C]
MHSENISILEKALPIMIASLTSTIVGGVIGFFSSNCTLAKNWERQKKYEQTNIAYAMYQEFSIRDKLINKIILNLKGKQNFEIMVISIYRDKDLYFIFRKEVSTFDNKLSNSIVKLYVYLESAEKQRKRVMAYIEDNFSPGKNELDLLIDKLEKVQQELQESLRLFQENFDFSKEKIAQLDDLI